VARNSDGRVTTSPAAVTTGAATLSMSQPRRAALAATPMVRARTTTDEMAPPTTEMTTKSAIEMVRVSPNPTATDLASTARASDTPSDRARAASMFCPNTVSARRDTRKVPVWMAVPSRLPMAPNTLPRMPMAAGTSTSRPGRRSRVWVMAPRVSPASRSPPDDTSSATSPWRMPAASAPTTARTRAPTRRAGRGRRDGPDMVARSSHTPTTAAKAPQEGTFAAVVARRPGHRSASSAGSTRR
jgi:hypothetical protein